MISTLSPSGVNDSEPGDTNVRRESAMLSWVQEIAPYGIFTTDAELRIQSWNRWLVLHSGRASETVVGRPLLEVFPELKVRKLDEPFRRALNGEVSVLSAALHRNLLPFPSTERESAFTHMQQTTRIAPLGAEGTILGTITVIEDVTHREAQAGMLRNQRDELKKHADTLEAKIADRTARLNETIVQLESFSYTVAHDLRAPIRALTGYSSILLTDFRERIPEDARFMLERLHRASDRLDALTRDLLSFSKVSRSDLELTIIDVDELVGEIALITPALQDGVLTIEGRIGEVWGQRMMLQQCLSNLFDNAVKFVAAGTRPRIVVYGERRPVEPANLDKRVPLVDGGAATASPAVRLRISVADNGVGVPRELQRRIFGIFERGAHTAGIEGTGIGLAIVERAVQRMGGCCGVESDPGKGSRFWLELTAA